MAEPVRRKSRREFLASIAKAAGIATAGAGLPLAIFKALSIRAKRRTGTLRDVEHIVILTQENRSFDHYFGTMGGVRGFGDPFPIPVPSRPGLERQTVWSQPRRHAVPIFSPITPFRLDTQRHLEYLRAEGTPHSFVDAQLAWSQGKLHEWTLAKRNHSMGYYAKDDIPFQWALAESFTICDAYHCSMHAGTNPNRLFIWSGTNDGGASGHGPAIYNHYDRFDDDPGLHGGYTWVTYAERLERAGVSWQVYENMDDNFTDNPLAGFVKFRDAWFQRDGFSQALRDRGVSTRDLDMLREDVLANRLPQVSWIVANAEGCEHPGPSSPAQGADYTAQVIEALTANPDVWSTTVLLVNFDENDGFFDHVPPPAPPSFESWDPSGERPVLSGASTVATDGEYHEHVHTYHESGLDRQLLHRPYGLGPRVPFYAVSPWSKGGWVNSQVFDHTSVIRFIEARFGVEEPNISAWRRAICGDLTSVFDFRGTAEEPFHLPQTGERAIWARSLGSRSTPLLPLVPHLPVQETRPRRSRKLHYDLHVGSRVERTDADQSVVQLTFANTGGVGAVFHVYDRHHLERIPRRFTVEASKSLIGSWSVDASIGYDLWVLGPNGFHRHFMGAIGPTMSSGDDLPDVTLAFEPANVALNFLLRNPTDESCVFTLQARRYYPSDRFTYHVDKRGARDVRWRLVHGPWYDFVVEVNGILFRRYAGRMETGEDSWSDPAMGGPACCDQEPGFLAR